MNRDAFISEQERGWSTEQRWAGITRPYRAADVWRLRGSLPIEHSLAKHGAARLWRLLHEEPYVPALSAVTGNQAVQEVRAGLKAVYVSGWQVAADANDAMQMYPDQASIRSTASRGSCAAFRTPCGGPTRSRTPTVMRASSGTCP